MLLLPSSLLALIWANGALATLIAERLPILSRADDSTCVQSYTSKNGLKFTTTYCNTNSPGHDLLTEPLRGIPSMTECMEHCSRYRDSAGQQLCYGVVWKTDPGLVCWLRNGNASLTLGLEENSLLHTSFVDRSQFKQLKKDCPNADLSKQTLDLGAEGSIEYQVQCNRIIGNRAETEWSGYPSSLPQPYKQFYHAESLEQCVRYCANEHPKCMAVSYITDITFGWANCIPKTDKGDLHAPKTEGKDVHSALLNFTLPIDTACPLNSTYTSSQSSTQFSITCNQDISGTGTDITVVHSQNIPSCMDTCASSNASCIGVVFDSQLSQGYKNCYLKNATNTTTSNFQLATYAAVLSRLSNDTSMDPRSSSGSSSSSTPVGSIAGGVIGGVVGLALIGATIFFLRRRKRNSGLVGPVSDTAVESKEGVEIDGYNMAGDGRGNYGHVHELETNRPTAEVAG